MRLNRIYLSQVHLKQLNVMIFFRNVNFLVLTN